MKEIESQEGQYDAIKLSNMPSYYMAACWARIMDRNKVGLTIDNVHVRPLRRLGGLHCGRGGLVSTAFFRLC